MFSFCILLIVSVSSAAVSYPNECQWIGADGMHGAYLPIGVCKHIFNPNVLNDPTDDHRYSTKYVCSDDGQTVHTKVWGNNSFCHGDDYGVLNTKLDGIEGDYFSCKGTGSCPYAVVRFEHQKYPNDPNLCELSDDGWYSEAPMTVYQCLNISNEWYMLSCTQNGKGLISTDYTANCKEKLNETILYDGCNYKDMFIKIMHCHYWDGNSDHIPTTTATETATVTTASSVVSTENIEKTTKMSTSVISTAVASTSKKMETTNIFLSTMVIDSGSKSDSNDHSGSDSYDDHHQHHHHHHGKHSSIFLHPLLFIIAAGLCIIFMLLCCCMSYKYYKQKKQIAIFTSVVGQYDKQIDKALDIEGDANHIDKNNTIVAEDTDTVLLNEGEHITFK